ncbi:DUF6668 family protein [Streptodolium elevatio]|uniref:DUF6668 family protein n=1 Tax=Streptodolium elevatio TaxID=3157996 RepID=A0ABV3D838_9ACTN
MGNPWIPADDSAVTERKPVVEHTPRPLRTQPPPSGAVPPPTRGGLPLRRRPDAHLAPWWWVGVHGGAGVGSLQACAPQSADGDRAWPVPEGQGTARVVLVCRSNFGGLRAAQSAVRQWAAGVVPNVAVLGLVVVADAPGRLPKPLRDLTTLVAGGVPLLWSVPWVEPWRLGHPPDPGNTPKAVVKLVAQISQPARRNSERSS